MRVLILGGMGMLGHRLWIELSADHEVWATVRDRWTDLPELPHVERRRIIEGLDVLDESALERTIAERRPDVVVNCVGMVKQHQLMSDPLLALRLNAVLPHQIASAAAPYGARVIQISTDCVFSGREGRYREEHLSDAEDLYGRTKYLGELPVPALTIRTSIIGRELRTAHGLAEWFLSQRSVARGFTRAIFSGLTTLELSHVIRRVVLPRGELAGVYHVGGPAIAKHDLLEILRRSYARDIEIVPDDKLVVDRSLDSSKFLHATGYVAPDWNEMIAAMVRADVPYDALRERLRRSGR